MSLTLKQIDSYIQALLDNAEELILEADTLYGANLYPRSFALAHFAREELSKCIILHATGCRIWSGMEIDWKRTMKRLRDHKSKLRLETVQNSLFAAAMGEPDKSELMAKNVESFANYRNYKKNSSLYVGISGGIVTRPSETVSKNQAFRTIQLAKASLEQEKGLWEATGSFASRKPGSEKNLTEFTSLRPEQTIEAIKQFAPKYKIFLDSISSDKKNLTKK